MEIDPAAVFDETDVLRARRLNRVLAVLPRYHTGRRWNARIINSLMRASQAIFPGIGRSVSTRQVSIPSRGKTIDLRLLGDADGIAGIYLHFHGGAWVLGNARLDDGWNAGFARACRIRVVSGDFHLATDDDLEQTMEDAVAILEWVLDHRHALGAERVIVGGESSGAHLAAVALLRVAAKRPPEAIAGFLSFCGAFDMRGSESLRDARKSLIVSARSARDNLDRLTAGAPAQSRSSPVISPIHAALSGMPPSLFIAGSLDPIVDDSRRMHARWQKDSGNAALLVAPEGPHGFERLPTRLACKTRTYAFAWIEQQFADAGRPQLRSASARGVPTI